MNIEPALFTEAAIPDEVRAFNAELRATLLSFPRTSDLTPEENRAARLEGDGPFGPVIYSDRARTVTIEGPGGDLDLRIIEPDGSPAGVYVHIHGGGWVLGTADQADVRNEDMAMGADVAVVSIDYRLAPEHPFPAGVEDCVAGTRWIIDNAAAEFGTERLTIGGESAGANLAAAVLQRSRDDFGYTSWLGANLVFGVYLPTGTPSVMAWDLDGYVLDADTMDWFRHHYVGSAEVPIDDPSFAPLYGDLRGMPPALFTVGTLDPLVDDTLFMATRWAASGAEALLEVHPGGVHAFDAFDTGMARSARSRMHEFIAAAVARG